jgi:hypothetical protein
MRIKYKYKVVKRKTRMSAMINGNSKYARRYLDGEKVYAHENSLGILLFETLEAADRWVSYWNEMEESQVDLIILKVIPIGRGKRIEWVSSRIDTEALDYFYSNKETTSLVQQVPRRTMAYPGVGVIGEYMWK